MKKYMLLKAKIAETYCAKNEDAYVVKKTYEEFYMRLNSCSNPNRYIICICICICINSILTNRNVV